MTGKTKINSWNEWDPLKHVIVGIPDGAMIAAPEPAAITGPEIGKPPDFWCPLPDDLVAKARVEMDNFAAILEERGARVDRLSPLVLNQKVQTPDWEQDSMFSLMPPRDFLLPVGNEIIEATMSQRSRWFEFIAYRDLLEQYFREDPNFLWSAAPKPRLTDDLYVEGFWEEIAEIEKNNPAEMVERTKRHQFSRTEVRPVWDAADALRLGKDIFIQMSMLTNKAGIDWLRRHLEPRGLRVHQVTFECPHPWHMDTTIFFPRAGTMFQNPNWLPVEPEFNELLRKNDWEIVHCAPAGRTKSHERCYYSVYLAYNVLSIDPKTICVEAAEKPLMEQLDQYGFEVIPVDFFEVSPFGGGLHCATVDIFREGDCEDYFPKQIKGF